MAEFDGFEMPVSAATMGASIGMFLGPIGLVGGALIGGIVDVAFGAKAKQKARKAMKKAFLAALMKRYNTQIFASSLERLGTGMIHLQSLGLKPGTPEFDKLLVKKLNTEIGYKGDCAIDLYAPVGQSSQRMVIASIDKTGKMIPYTPHIDLDLGNKWSEACKELHKLALKSWAEDQAENIVMQREMEKETAESQRNAITRFLVNGGLIMLMFGYTIRQKRKLKSLRGEKVKDAA